MNNFNKLNNFLKINNYPISFENNNDNKLKSSKKEILNDIDI